MKNSEYYDIILVDKNNNYINNLSKALDEVFEDKILQERMYKKALEQSKYFTKERYADDVTCYLNKV